MNSLTGRPRQVVFGDDDAGCPAVGTRQGLERKLPLVAFAQIDAGEVFGLLAERLRVAHPRRVEHALRLDRLAHRRIAAHAGEHVRPLIRVVTRADDPLERVAARAIEQERLLLLAAGQAHHPFGIAHLRGEVLGLAQLEVHRGGPLGGDIGSRRADEVVADGADLERVFACAQSIGGEAVAALRIADHADGDGRARFLGADHHALHGAFRLGGDLPGQGDRRLGLRPHEVGGCRQDQGGQAGAHAQP